MQALCVIGLSAIPSQALAQACGAEIREELQRQGITPDDIAGVRMQGVAQSHRGGGRLIGWEAWIKRNSCDGQTVVQMRRTCRITGSYATGKCKK
ncbi:MAG: hypothetical protein QNJ92_16375 [Alphaproteobacteria bacterium]|nr:hypothetical protein [Alphaproteobacteria bacterium]